VTALVAVFEAAIRVASIYVIKIEIEVKKKIWKSDI